MCWVIAEILWQRKETSLSVLMWLLGFFELTFYAGLFVGWVIWS